MDSIVLLSQYLPSAQALMSKPTLVFYCQSHSNKLSSVASAGPQISAKCDQCDDHHDYHIIVIISFLICHFEAIVCQHKTALSSLPPFCPCRPLPVLHPPPLKLITTIENINKAIYWRSIGAPTSPTG